MLKWLENHETKGAVGITCGAFDLLHAGHITMLAEAKNECDYLVVALQNDPSYDRPEKNKPIQSLVERQLQVAAVRYVDDIIVYNTEEDLKDVEIHGIAYCVGSIDLKPINLITKKDYLKSFELNFFPIVDIIKKFQENLKRNKSSIVLFSTVAVKQGFPNHSIISPVKASLEGLTVSLASELAPNIRINCIAPSLSNSKMASKLLRNTKISEAIAKQHH